MLKQTHVHALDYYQSFAQLSHLEVPLTVLFLVSTYVVCERLSVMHEPAGVVEILVQILQYTPILKSTPLPLPPRKLKFRQILAL